MAVTVGGRVRRVRGRAVRSLAGWLLAFASVGAPAGTVILSTDLTGVTLTGTGWVPLAGSAVPGGYELVEATVDVRQPAGLVSSGVTVVSVSATDPANPVVALSTSFEFHLDVRLTEITPGAFHPGLGGEVYVPAVPSEPLSAVLSAEFAFVDLLGILDGSLTPTFVSSVSTRSHPLGVDINGDGTEDVLSFDALDINFLDEEDISFDLGAGSTVDDLVAAILAAGLNPGDPIVLAGTLAVSSLSVEFVGSVNPPFSVTLSGSIGPVVPVPPALLLLASATLVLGALRCRGAP